MRDDHPHYDIGEYLLCGLFIGAACVALIWAAASLWRGERFSAAEGAGLALMFLGGGAHPKQYVLDCLTFPFTLLERSGRETPLTLFAAGAGCVLWLLGLAGNQWLA